MDSNQLQLPIRNAGLYSAIRACVIEIFDTVRGEVAGGTDVTFSVAAHDPDGGGTALYEYQPMIRGFIGDRMGTLMQLGASITAAQALATDPASNALLRAGRADVLVDLIVLARNEVLIPLVTTLAEASPDFVLDETLLLSQYLRFERTLYSEHRRYAAIVPLWAVRLVYGDIQLAPGVRIRSVDPELFRMEWPEASQLNWGPHSRDGLPAVVLEFERAVDDDDFESMLDPLPALTQVVSVIRALAGGGVYAGPVVWERFDYRTLAPRPVPALAARPCGTSVSKIDGTITNTLPDALRRLTADPNGRVARALECFQIGITTRDLSALRLMFNSLLDIYADEREVMSAGLRLAAIVGSSIVERQQYVSAMRTASLIIRSGNSTHEDLPEIAGLLASGLRATIAAALIGELPVSGLQDYADGILLGERTRKRLGVMSLGSA